MSDISNAVLISKGQVVGASSGGSEPVEIEYVDYMQLTDAQKLAGTWYVLNWPANDNPALGAKADKVIGATADNLASLDSDGNLQDSGKSIDDFVSTEDFEKAVTQTSGVLDDMVKANATAVATLGTAQVRNIYAGTADMTAGVTVLTTGDIYIVYEA